jgi:hypothetical protein
MGAGNSKIWYIEFVIDDQDGVFPLIGISLSSYVFTGANDYAGEDANGWSYRADGTLITSASTQSYGATFTDTDVIGMLITESTGTVTFYKQTSGSGSFATQGTFVSGLQGDCLISVLPKGTTAEVTARVDSADWGNSSPPAGAEALSQDNLPSTDQFISALSWIKNRDAADNNMLFDRVRGVTKDLHSNVAEAEVTNVETVQRFLSAGVQVGSDAEVNTSAESYALWNFMMQTTGSGSSNEAGSINTTSTLVDTTLGLSISKYTGTGSNATVGHGLGVAPNMMLIKNLGTTDAWSVYYGDNTDYIVFNTAAGTVDDATMWNDTSPTSTVFSIGSNHSVNASSENYIAYCFANSQFISVGSYTGNENTDGTFVPTINSLGVPIQPVWVMVKNSVQARSWNIIDTARNPYNVSNYVLEADTTTAQQTGSDTLWNMDIDTGGFKLRSSHETSNGAETMIYLVIGTPIIDTDGRIIAGR